MTHEKLKLIFSHFEYFIYNYNIHMTDNQIVDDIILSINSIQFGSDGTRYIAGSNGTYQIYEFSHGKFETAADDALPKYIFVRNSMKTVILYNKKIWKLNKWFICASCGKITNIRMKYMYNKEEICVHCFFIMNYDNPDKKTYDKAPLTIGKYIKKYAYRHNSEICNSTERCFLCDYNKGKLLLDINDRELLYRGSNLREIIADRTLDIEI